MSKIDDAADQVRGMAERFRAIIDVADVLKNIGSLEQAAIERQAALETATKDHEAAKTELDAVKSTLDEQRDIAAAELERHKATCAAMSLEAAAKAENILGQAKGAAEVLMDATKAELLGIQQTHDATIADRRSILASLKAEIDAAQEKLDEITHAHANTAQQIEALKAAAKSVLGG